MAEPKKEATTIRIRKQRVRVILSGSFQDELAAWGGRPLWPDRPVVNRGDVGTTPDRFFDFEFSSPEDAYTFAVEAGKKIVEAKKEIDWQD